MSNAAIRGITEDDFTALADAANAALARGDLWTAECLDKMARKANASLSNANLLALSVWTTRSNSLTWKDVPSVLTGVSP